MNVLNRFQLNWFLNMLCQVEASSSGVGHGSEGRKRIWGSSTVQLVTLIATGRGPREFGTPDCLNVGFVQDCLHPQFCEDEPGSHCALGPRLEAAWVAPWESTSLLGAHHRPGLGFVLPDPRFMQLLLPRKGRGTAMISDVREAQICHVQSWGFPAMSSSQRAEPWQGRLDFF